MSLSDRSSSTNVLLFDDFDQKQSKGPLEARIQLARCCCGITLGAPEGSYTGGALRVTWGSATIADAGKLG